MPNLFNPVFDIGCYNPVYLRRDQRTLEKCLANMFIYLQLGTADINCFSFYESQLFLRARYHLKNIFAVLKTKTLILAL